WLTWIGRRRYENAINNNRDAGAGPSRDDHSPANHIRGIKCEFAASVILNLSWRPHVGDIKQRDVGGLIEARSTVLPNGRLIVKPNESDDAPFVLVRQHEDDERYRLLGWVFGWEAKLYELLTCFGDPAHFVPQRDLRFVDELRRWIGVRR